MKPQEMIDVIQAHADGKQLQMRPKGDGMWIDCKPPSPMFDFCHYEYRVKPPAPAMWQYYWRNNNCTAHDSNDKDCQCWWDEGAGPLASTRHDDKYKSHMTWRPTNLPAPTLRPHWPAVVFIASQDKWLVTDSLYAYLSEAIQCETLAGHTGDVRLATEYPPVMLP